MLGQALWHDPTHHTAPSDEQLNGLPEKGIAPVWWNGDDATRIRSLIESFLSTIQKRYPEILNARYDFDSGHFLDADGMPLRFSRAQKPAIEAGNADSAEMETEAREAGTRAGQATLRRAIFLQSLVSGASSERPELLEQMELWNREYVTSGKTLVHQMHERGDCGWCQERLLGLPLFCSSRKAADATKAVDV